MATLTIFTPAYNRAHTISRTYKSLCRQSCKDFVWLVVDDGSSDNTHELVDGCWQQHGNDKVAGLIGLDVTQEGKVIGTKFPDGMTTTTLQGFYEAGGRGDKKMVYRTDVINQYPEYPLFEGERYVGLAYKYYITVNCIYISYHC